MTTHQHSLRDTVDCSMWDDDRKPLPKRDRPLDGTADATEAPAPAKRAKNQKPYTPKTPEQLAAALRGRAAGLEKARVKASAKAAAFADRVLAVIAANPGIEISEVVARIRRTGHIANPSRVNQIARQHLAAGKVRRALVEGRTPATYAYEATP